MEDASLEQMETFVEKWLHEHEWLDEDTEEHKKTAIKVGVSTMGRLAHSAGESFGLAMTALGATVGSTFKTIESMAPKFEQPKIEQSHDLLLGSTNEEEPQV